VSFFKINFLVRKSFWLFEFNNEITETASYNIKILYLYRKQSIKTYFWRKISLNVLPTAVEDLLGLETFMRVWKYSYKQSKCSLVHSFQMSAVFSPNSSLPKINNFIYMLTSLRHSPGSIHSEFPFILLSLQKVLNLSRPVSADI